jgi:quercetin dioxygenase-like cupin family protein
MPLYVRDEEIKDDTVKTQYTVMSTKMVYGNESSLMLATRPGGYHSRPHIHDTEQMNYVIDGEIWVFVDDQFFLVKAGDFYRVPAMAVHWGWITSDKPCTILEVFAPPYVSSSHANAVPLYADGEAPVPKKPVRNYFVSDDYRKIEEKLPVAKTR